jgi:hypothetical protein
MHPDWTANGAKNADGDLLNPDDAIGYYCFFANATTLVVFLGDGDTFEPYQNVTLNEDYPGWTLSSPTATLLPPLNPVSPHVSLSGPQQVSCLAADQSFKVWATGASGSGGRPFVDGFRWSVTAVGALPDTFAELEARVSGTDGNTLEIEGGMLTEGVTYTFTLSLTNRFGLSSSQDFVIYVRPQNVDEPVHAPNIRILGSSSFDITADRDIGFVAVIYPIGTECTVVDPDTVTSVAWSRVDGPLLAFDPVTSVTPSLTLNAERNGPLHAPASYTLQIDASNDAPDTFPLREVSSSRVTVDVVSAPIVAVLRPGNRQVGRGSPVLFNALFSHDPNNEVDERFSFSWRCWTIPENVADADELDRPTAEACPVDEYVRTVTAGAFTVPPYNLPIGRFAFAVTVSKGERSSTVLSTVDIVFDDVPIIGTWFDRQNGLPVTSLLNPSSLLVINGVVAPFPDDEPGRGQFSYQWTHDIAGLDDSVDQATYFPVGLNARDLFIAAGTMPFGQRVHFTLTVTDGTNASATSFIGATTNIPPTGGACVAAIEDGPAYIEPGELATVEYVAIECADWEVVDKANSPLLYTYYWCPNTGAPDASDCVDQRWLLGPLHGASLSLRLPSNALTTRMVVVVSDSMLTSSRRVVSIAPKSSTRRRRKRDVQQSAAALADAHYSIRNADLLGAITYSTDSVNYLESTTDSDCGLEPQLYDIAMFLNDDLHLPASSTAFVWELGMYRTLL